MADITANEYIDVYNGLVNTQLPTEEGISYGRVSCSKYKYTIKKTQAKSRLLFLYKREEKLSKNFRTKRVYNRK